MLRSMTAFAHVESRGDRGGVEWEIRSVNNCYLDVNVRLPEDLRGLDPKGRSTTRAAGRHAEPYCIWLPGALFE